MSNDKHKALQVRVNRHLPVGLLEVRVIAICAIICTSAQMLLLIRLLF